jgi:hypothetical protein
MSDKKDKQEEQAKEFATGFAVLIGKDGNIFLEMKKDVFSVTVDRDSSLREVRRYMAEILSDIQAQSAAEYTLLKLSAINANSNQESN